MPLVTEHFQEGIITQPSKTGRELTGQEALQYVEGQIGQ